jgi:hypothetical protein
MGRIGKVAREVVKSLIISDNQDETCLIITINDASIGDLPLIITISDTCKNQPKSLDSDNTINLSILIVSLVTNTRHSDGAPDPDGTLMTVVRITIRYYHKLVCDLLPLE